MTARGARRLRCAVYTRKSSEDGLDQAFNSLDAQREACEAYIKSQVGEGWRLVKTRYDDGGVSGGTMDRPALRKLLDDIRARTIDTVVVYKVDRLTRSLADFAKIVEVFDAHGVSFVSVTQQFNTTTSMGRLTLNMLLSFAQFEREVTGERIRDKIAASKRKGMWMGGFVPLGYDAKDRTLMVNEAEAETVRTVFRLYLEFGNVRQVKEEIDRLGLTTKLRTTGEGKMRGGRPLSRGYLYRLLANPLYTGRIAHKGTVYEGQHAPIIDAGTWDAVQAKLTSNAHGRRAGCGAAEPSLLAGFLHDEQGHRLSPSHAVKNGVRYRYYVNQSVQQNRPDGGAAAMRMPAREIEQLVGAAIVTLLRDPARVIDELAKSRAPREQQRLLAAATRRANQWDGDAVPARRAFLSTVLARAIVSETEVRLELRRFALTQLLISKSGGADQRVVDGEGAAEDLLIIRTPARLARCSRAMRLVIPAGAAHRQAPRPDPVLIKAVTRAHAWKDRLLSGNAPSIRAIAKAEGLRETYVGRIVRLAFLAPDIIEAILDGHQPADLDLRTLMKTPIPLAWTDQRRVYRFAGC